MTGDVQRADALVTDAEALGQRLEAQPAPIYAAGQRFALLRQANRLQEAEEEVRRSAARWPVLATFRCMLAVLLADLDRREEAVAILDGLVPDGCAALPRDSLWLASVSLLAETAAEVESAEHAAALHEILRPYAGRVVVQGVVAWWGAVDHYLARTAAVLGRLDEAEAAFRSALRVHESWGATPFVAATLTGLAEMLRRRASDDDHARAARMDAEAMSLAPERHKVDVSTAESRRAARVLVTVLFVDVVGSTALAARIGDAAWSALRSEFLIAARAELKTYEGTEIDVAGDGLFATFTAPARAIRCAAAIGRRCGTIGLEIRAGVHTGEVEQDDRGGVSGLTVHIGARIMAEAGAGEVLVSGMVKDLVVGAGLTFTDRGTRQLRGVPGSWPVFGVAG
jgi:class 3 adenylate cyclase